MKIIKLIADQYYDVKESCVAIGFFDGLHLGHMQLLDRVEKISKEKNLKKAFMTFDVHPKTVFSSDKFPCLMTLQQKIEIVEKLGFDYFYIIHFDASIASLNPEDFIDQYIIHNQIRHIVCGFDFTFGRYGKGNVETLKALSQDRYDIDVIDKYEINGKKVSSSLIRHYIKEGEMEKASVLLNRPYRITGIVIHGKKNGHKIGFPTANISIEETLLKKGVYSVYIYVDGKRYKGMANIGMNPTFGLINKPSLEVHIFDFDKDIYGDMANVDFMGYVRGEVHFSSVDKLIDQLNHDKQYIDSILD